MPRTQQALDAILAALFEQREPSFEGRLRRELDGQARLSAVRGAGRRPTEPVPPLAASAATTIHQVKVSLRGAKPPVWRRLEVPSDLPLSLVHEVVQTAFGWFDCHLHVFETACGEFGDPAQDGGWAWRGDESAVALAQVAAEARSKVRYLYDFGDDWRHQIVVEAVVPATPGVRYPRCTAGRGAAPEEDSGGIAVHNAKHPDRTAIDPGALTRQLAGLAGVVVPA